MMKVWGVTDIGLVRRENQDAFGMREQTPTGHTICVVCDGMGGAVGGSLASSVAVETFIEEVERVLRPDMAAEQLREACSYAVSLTNKELRRIVDENPDYEGMGTTLVSAVTYSDGVVLCNVGDSRAYHISKNGIARVTKDHSWVERMIDRGDLTEEEARHHPNRNLITRALGPDDGTEADGYICPMEQGDFLLLCSDGLVNTVTDQEMLFEVLHGGDPDTCLDRLLTIAKNQGAPDNVTVVLMQNL